MFFTDFWFWAAAVLFVAVLVLGVPRLVSWFNPLIQIVGEQPHHLYFMRDARLCQMLAYVMEDAGHKPFGMFSAGVDQLLFRDGSTVFARSGEDTPAVALIVPVTRNWGLQEAAESAQRRLEVLDIHAHPAWVPGMEGRIIRLHIESQLGYDIGFRLEGRKMAKFGLPKFVRWHR